MTDSVSQDPDGFRGRVLAAISVATILALSLWFSTNAIGPALVREKVFSTSDLSWLTIAVQLGFGVGTLIRAFLNLPERIPARVFFGGYQGRSPPKPGRCAVGRVRPGVLCPVWDGRRAGWYVPHRNEDCVRMVPGRTCGSPWRYDCSSYPIGSGSPHLLGSAFVDDWEVTVYGSSMLALAGGLLVLAIGPALGSLSMLRLRSFPESRKLALGLR